MADISDLAPKRQQRVIDLVSAAGVDVSDWANFKGGAQNAAWNPKYCYEWAFIEPKKVVVLNLWFENLSVRDGEIVQDLNLREWARRYAGISKTQQAKRASNADLAIQTAVKEDLPIRVIVCDGKMSDASETDSKPSRVKKRLLDPVTWRITDYDRDSGQSTVPRNDQNEYLAIETLETAFHLKTIEVYELGKRLFGYNATRFLQRVRRVGGLTAARGWLDPKRGFTPTKGFLKLVEKKRLDISLEALVLRRPWHELFTPSELSVAAGRLRKYGYTGEELAQDPLIREAVFKPKNDQEYFAWIRGGLQKRSRNHEKLVTQAAAFFRKQGFSISNRHPIDLSIDSPLKIIFEAKLVGTRSAVFAIRNAIGQLYEYRYFLGPEDANLCVLLDREPEKPIIVYVEKVLGVLIVWSAGATFAAGPETKKLFSQLGISID